MILDRGHIETKGRKDTDTEDFTESEYDEQSETDDSQTSNAEDEVVMTIRGAEEYREEELDVFNRSGMKQLLTDKLSHLSQVY